MIYKIFILLLFFGSGSNIVVIIYRQIIKSMTDHLQKLKTHYPWLDPHEWTCNKVKKGFVITNNFTFEDYSTEDIFMPSAQIKQIYKVRATCPIPHTPKIIISSFQKDKQTLNILVQRAPINIETYLKRLPDFILVLEKFRLLLTVVEALAKKYGHFRIVPNMIKANKIGFFQIWINQFEQSCYREFPLNSQNPTEDARTMVLDLINIFMKNGHSQILSSLHKKVAGEKSISFETAKADAYALLMRKRRIIPLKSNIMRAQSPQPSQGKVPTPSFIKNKKQNFPRSSKNKINDQKKNSSMVYLKKSESPRKSTMNYTHASQVFGNLNSSDHSLRAKIQRQKAEKERMELNGNTKSNQRLSKMEHNQISLFNPNPVSKKQMVPIYISTPQSPTQEGLFETENESSQIFAQRRKTYFRFRDSGGSDSNYHHSAKSSEKTAAESSSFQLQKTISSLGTRVDDLKQPYKFKIMSSKIIEEHNEETPNSTHMFEPTQLSIRQKESQLSKDMELILESQIFENKKKFIRKKTQDRESFLENQMRNLLSS